MRANDEKSDGGSDHKQVGANTWKCPSCAEEIQKDAKKCRFCGMILTKAAKMGYPAFYESVAKDSLSFTSLLFDYADFLYPDEGWIDCCLSASNILGNFFDNPDDDHKTKLLERAGGIVKAMRERLSDIPAESQEALTIKAGCKFLWMVRDFARPGDPINDPHTLQFAISHFTELRQTLSRIEPEGRRDLEQHIDYAIEACQDQLGRTGKTSSEPVSRGTDDSAQKERELREKATAALQEMAASPAHAEVLAEQADAVRRAKASIVWSVIISALVGVLAIPLLVGMKELPVIARLSIYLIWVYGAWSTFWGWKVVWPWWKNLDLFGKLGCFLIANPITLMILMLIKFMLFIYIPLIGAMMYGVYGGGFYQFLKHWKLAKGREFLLRGKPVHGWQCVVGAFALSFLLAIPMMIGAALQSKKPVSSPAASPGYRGEQRQFPQGRNEAANQGITVAPQSPLGTVNSRLRAAPPAQRGMGEAKLYFNRGEGDCLRGNFDKAIFDCSKAIELDPTLARAYTYRGRAFNGKGDFEKGIADCSKAIELEPADYEAYHNRGFSYFGKGDYDNTIADWSKAIELKPKNPWPYKDRSRAYCAKGDYDNAWADVKKCQALGGRVAPDDLDKLRKASGRSE